MFKPDDPLKPRTETFLEPWHAQVLAMADAMVQAGHITAQDWAESLGAQLRAVDKDGQPDTEETYYTAALAALEILSAGIGIPAETQADRKNAWKSAYLNTPHGQPVTLKSAQKA